MGGGGGSARPRGTGAGRQEWACACQSMGRGTRGSLCAHGGLYTTPEGIPGVCDTCVSEDIRTHPCLCVCWRLRVCVFESV